LPNLLDRNRSTRRLRVWSAGCSVGAEAYSVAILLRRDFARELAGWDVTIRGTDINRHFLSRAREGCYEEWALRNTTAEFRQTHFVRSGQSWCIAPLYREGVSFQYHNLVAHPFPSLWKDLCAFDLILCRNVMIYFDLALARRIVTQLQQSLVEGGWLAVGHAEPNTELFAAFRIHNAAGAVLYQKEATAVLPRWTPPVLAQPWPVPDTAVDRPREQPPALDLAAIRALADRGAWDEADRSCRQAQTQDRLNPQVYFCHALVLEQTGRHAEAERALRQSLYLDRRFVLAHYYLGLLLQKQGHFPAAVRSFENVRALIAGSDPAQVFAEADGITAGEIDKLTRMHLEALEGG
jgi:chemotaxis protein methyltransferase CheR